MSAHPNGVAVGDILVLLESEERRGLRALLLAAFWQSHEGVDTRLVVRKGKDVVATRTFRDGRRADRVRDFFVAEAERTYSSGAAVTYTGWQRILDEVAMQA